MRKPPLRNARQNAAYPVSLHGYYSARSDDGSAILEGDESFADLFAASLNSPRKAVARRDPELGDLVQGEIVQIGAEFAFLDIGGKSEAMISLDELRNESGELTARIGDKLEGHVISVSGKEGGLLISGRLQKGTGLSDQLRQAFQQGAPVQGLVTGANKGGLDIDLGGVRAFLPSSQIDLRYCQDHTTYIGRALTLRVIRFDEESRTVIVSRRAILEVDLRPLAEDTKSRLRVGAVFNGTLVAIQEPNAVVDLGGIDGWVATADIQNALRAVGRTEDTIKLGQRVEVEVTRLDQQTRNDPYLSSLQGSVRVHLALRSLLADPLDEMLGKLSEGERVTGRIVRLEPFGAFVELQPTVEGLIHVSAMSERHITHPREILTLGQEITATVINLDRERRRIGLSLIEEIRAAQAVVANSLVLGSRNRVRVERIEPNGAIVRVIVDGVAESSYPRGLMPNGELNVPRGSDIKRLFPIGKEYVAAIQSVDSEGRVRLSLRIAAEQEQAEAAQAAEAARQAAEQAAIAALQAQQEAAKAALDAGTAATKKRASRSKKTPTPTELAAAILDVPVDLDTEPKKKTASKRKTTASDAASVVPPASEVPEVRESGASRPPAKGKKPRGIAEPASERAPEAAPLAPQSEGKTKSARKKTTEPAAAEHVAATTLDVATRVSVLTDSDASKAPKKRVRKTA
ncbi:MAG: S1 RNA-binding domain-containing protein [Myxococcales bacterium]|nr:S1 RNA-binding domain-containing protein [Myxococcales bacterium]